MRAKSVKPVPASTDPVDCRKQPTLRLPGPNGRLRSVALQETRWLRLVVVEGSARQYQRSGPLRGALTARVEAGPGSGEERDEREGLRSLGRLIPGPDQALGR